MWMETHYNENRQVAGKFFYVATENWHLTEYSIILSIYVSFKAPTVHSNYSSPANKDTHQVEKSQNDLQLPRTDRGRA